MNLNKTKLLDQVSNHILKLYLKQSIPMKFKIMYINFIQNKYFNWIKSQAFQLDSLFCFLM